MNLLPKSHQDFSQKEYWNTFFKKRGKKAFEWYGEYPELCGQIHKYVKPKDEVLMVGCGNSTLSSDLYDVGYKLITNIDISQVAIKQMQSSNKERRPDMKFIHMDALNMVFEEGQFSVVFDKGTLDALMPDDSEEVSERIDKFFGEVGRVLRLGGRYICISLLQDHILKKMLAYFANINWMFRIVRCHEAEQKTADSGESTVMPVFAVIVTKFKLLPRVILEVCMGGEKMQRLTSPEEVIAIVRSAQDAALVTNGLTNSSLVGLDEVYLDLMKPGEDTPRYTVHVLDQKGTRGSGVFAAFIVPLGRETDWLFSTPEGRKKLLQSAGYNRLAIISMHRDQTYESLEVVKDELSMSVKSLAPKGLTKEVQKTIPYLSLGLDVGKRDTVFKGFSNVSGDFVVEDVVGGVDNTFRRLIFLKNPFLIQSEAKLKIVARTMKGKLKMMVDPGYLACSHHIFMTVGVQLAIQNLQSQDSPPRMAMVGLGGGGLCTFLHRCFPDLSIQAVDIDQAILQVAISYFGLECDERLDVLIQDGIEFIKNSKEKGDKFDAILFDVDSKDTSIGMSCPPKNFLEKEVLNNIKCCIGDRGFFVLNLVCRDESLRKKVLGDLKLSFSNIASYKLPQEVNEVFYCTNIGTITRWVNDLEAASKAVNAKAIASKLQYEDVVDIPALLEALNINV